MALVRPVVGVTYDLSLSSRERSMNNSANVRFSRKRTFMLNTTKRRDI